MPTIYLAGPEVFLPDAVAIMSEKRRLARSFGFEPTGPGSDENAVPSGPPSAAAIYERNDKAMRRADFCLANITPFRGVSADPGTVYEIGFMLALDKTVWAYTNHPDDYGARVKSIWYAGSVVSDGDRQRGADGLAIENHGKADNLMIDGGIEASGGRVIRAALVPADPARDLAVYTEALRLLAGL